jgi:redox-sensitive bicupin YhaK (pirin superfamily)
MSWGNLKVINDDIQQPGNQVPDHEHKNYDILGYMVAGELEHTDSLGNVGRARPGQIQHMWCGSSIWHTEASVGTVPARYLQLWIIPQQKYFNTDPFYEVVEKSPKFGDLGISLKQEMRIRGGILSESVITNKAYLYVVAGTCSVNGIILNEGDGAELSSETVIPVDNSHIILFEPNIF